MRVVNKDTEKEGQADLAEAPTKEDERKELPISVHKEIHLKPEGSRCPVHYDCEEEDYEVEGEVYEPVVAHFHPIDFHSFQQLRLLLKHEVIDKDRQSYG